MNLMALQEGLIQHNAWQKESNQQAEQQAYVYVW